MRQHLQKKIEYLTGKVTNMSETVSINEALPRSPLPLFNVAKDISQNFKIVESPDVVS